MADITLSVLALYTMGAERLEAAVSGLSDAQFNLSCAPGEWSIRQIVHHLEDGEGVWSGVIRKAVATPGAPVVFEGFPGNEPWADALAFDKRAVQPALTLFKTYRQVVAELLTLCPQAWDQHVTFFNLQGQELQKFTVREMIPMLTEHLEEHLKTIEQIKALHGI